jgi:adenylosuccinate synthase
LLTEMAALEKRGIYITPKRLVISNICHIILPFHKLIDNQQEAVRNEEKIGTTGRGIGPAYTDKISRIGIRMLDLLDKDEFIRKIKRQDWLELINNLDMSLEEVVEKYYNYGQKLKEHVVDTSLFINESISRGKKIIMEGAQGTMLDVDHGTYPFVTSSNPIAGAACIGAGIGPHKIDQVIGVVKAYATRVGEGPFTTEEKGEKGAYLRDKGCEFGTTTNRPRRCGWLDLVVLRYAIRVNGITELCLTKLDVLDELKTIKVCTCYETENGQIRNFPLNLKSFSQARPVYDEIPGWEQNISRINKYEDLPQNAKNYVKYISNLMGVNISLISVGSKRNQTIHLLER